MEMPSAPKIVQGRVSSRPQTPASKAHVRGLNGGTKTYITGTFPLPVTGVDSAVGHLSSPPGSPTASPPSSPELWLLANEPGSNAAEAGRMALDRVGAFTLGESLSSAVQTTEDKKSARSPKATPGTWGSLVPPTLSDVPAGPLQLILSELKAQDLSHVECVSRTICWPESSPGSRLGPSLAEEAAESMMQGFHGFERRAGECWKQALNRAQRSGYTRRLSAGWRHTAMAHPGERMFVMGNGGSGRLGFQVENPTQCVSTPRQLNFDNIVQVSAGVNTTLMLKEDGGVISCGYNFANSAGPGDSSYNTNHLPVPMVMPGGVKVVTIGAGSMHSAAVSESGDLFTWGFGRFGALGHGSVESMLAPTKVENIPPLWHVSCGGLFTACVTRKGEIWTFGSGYIGHGCRSFELVLPKKVQQLPETATDVSCGKDHAAVVTTSGRLYTFGMGRDGRLGHGGVKTERAPRLVDEIQGRVQQVSCGRAHTAALLRSGVVVTFGNGGHGRLGHGNTSNQLKPNVVEAFIELTNESLPVANIGGARRCAAVSCGGTHTAVAMTNGELFVFGDGGDGQLGLGKASMGSVLSPQPVNVKTVQSVMWSGEDVE